MTDYKPGQLAKATVRGVPDVTMMRDYDGSWYVPTDQQDGRQFFDDLDVTDVRPLVVLGQLDAKDCVTALRKALDVERSVSACVNIGSVISAIEAQTRPAIEEPTGLGAVVEDDKGARWVRADEDDVRWTAIGEGWLAWPDLNPVRILSEGVRP